MAYFGISILASMALVYCLFCQNGIGDFSALMH